MPVRRPTLNGKSRFITTGTSTLHIPIVTPMSAVPKNNSQIEGSERKTMPTHIRSIQNSNVFSTPILREILGATKENKEKASNGNVVKSPANVFESPVSPWILLIKAPTPVMGERKVVAVNRIAVMISIVVFNVFDDFVNLTDSSVLGLELEPFVSALLFNLNDLLLYISTLN